MGILYILLVIVVECGCDGIVTLPVRGVKRPEGGVDRAVPSVAMRRVRETLSRSSHRHLYVTIPHAYTRQPPPRLEAISGT